MAKLLKRRPLYYLKNIKRYLERAALSFSPPHKPDFMIIGAQKSATTSLFNYLNQLPEFHGALNKEIYYFDREINHGKNLEWYHGFFRGLSGGEGHYYFEATPNYLYYPEVPEKLLDYNPALKLVIVLREPVSRAFSAWNMYKAFFEKGEMYRLKRGRFPEERNYIYEYLFRDKTSFPSFDEAVDIELQLIAKSPGIEEPSLLRRGLYAQQIERYLTFFPKEQIHVAGYQDLIQLPGQTVAEICQFISGKKMHDIKFIPTARNSRNYKNRMSENTHRLLSDFYAGSNEELFSLLKRKISW